MQVKNSKIKIHWITPSKLVRPSSRIRMYSLYKEISKNKKFETFYTCVDYLQPFKKSTNHEIDVLILQKRLRKKVITYIKEKIKPKLIIFDLFDGRVKNPKIKPAVDLADIITVSNNVLKKHVNDIYPLKTCYVMPDCIDYYPQKPLPPTKYSYVLSWFGNSRNLNNIMWQLEYLKNTKYKINMMLPQVHKKDKRLYSVLKKISFVGWSIETFIKEIRKTSISLLSQANKKGKQKGKFLLKSNNRMTTSIVYGIPAIINNSIEYEKLAKQFNLDYSIVNNEDEFKNALDYLKHYENREKYLKDIQPYVWENYSPEAVSKKLLELIKKHL